MFTTNKNQTIANKYTASITKYEIIFFKKKLKWKNERNTDVFKSRGLPWPTHGEEKRSQKQIKNEEIWE